MSELINFYDRIDSGIKYRNPVKNALQHPFNACLVGGTGAGKTNSALNIILHGKNFDNFIIVTRQVDEPLYSYLKKVIGDIAPERITIVDNITKMPKMDELDQDLQTLLIFDDQVTEGKKVQDEIAKIFIRCRKKGCSSMYLSQAYYGIPKTIRLNCQYLVLKSIASKKEVKAIIKDYALNLEDNELLNMFNDATGKMTDFLLIDIKSKNQGNHDMAYRKNFNPINGKKNNEQEGGKIKPKPKKKMTDLEYLQSLKK